MKIAGRYECAKCRDLGPILITVDAEELIAPFMEALGLPLFSPPKEAVTQSVAPPPKCEKCGGDEFYWVLQALDRKPLTSQNPPS